MYLTNAQKNTIRHYFSVYEMGKEYKTADVIAERDYGIYNTFGVDYFLGSFLVRIDNEVYRFDCDYRKGELGGTIYDVKGKKLRVGK